MKKITKLIRENKKIHGFHNPVTHHKQPDWNFEGASLGAERKRKSISTHALGLGKQRKRISPMSGQVS